MKRGRFLGLANAFLAPLVLACSSAASADRSTSDGGTTAEDSSSPGDQSTGSVDSGGNAADAAEAAPPGLSCQAYGVCTDYRAANAAPTNAPGLSGGTISDGLYRAEEGTLGTDALLFQGPSVLSVGLSSTNHLGTWSVSNNILSLSFDTACDSSGPYSSSTHVAYQFAVSGGDLYVQLGTDATTLTRYHPVTTICNADSSFQCYVSNCYCSEASNQALTACQ